MEDTSDKDYLGFKNDSAIKSIIGDEKLLFSDKIIKVNRYGLSQERNILITDKAIYNLKRKISKRRIPLKIIFGITINKLTDEFVIHGTDAEYDYYYISHKRSQILQTIYSAYCELFPNEKFKFAALTEKSLKNYVTSKKEKKNKSNNYPYG